MVLRCPVERIERDGARSLPSDHRRRESRHHHLQAHLVISAGLHASKLAGTLALRRRLSAARDLLRQGPLLRALGAFPLQAPHLSHARRRVARPARHRRRRRALQVRAPTSPGSPGIDYGFEVEKLGQFLDFIRSYYPGLEVERLHPDYTGIRPKLYRKASRCRTSPFTGHAQHGQDGLVALFGIESPGLTASLAIGEVVADMLKGDRG